MCPIFTHGLVALDDIYQGLWDHRTPDKRQNKGAAHLNELWPDWPLRSARDDRSTPAWIIPLRRALAADYGRSKTEGEGKGGYLSPPVFLSCDLRKSA